MPKPTSTLTPETILAHERLYPRLASLLKQVERVAAQRPTQPVPAESVKLARELCQEAAQLLGKQGRGIVVPRGAAGVLDHASLAVALGQAVAGLEAFEGEHAQLSARHQAICWTLPDGKRQPVARLLPRTPPKGATVWDEAEREFGKAEHDIVIRRLIDRENAVYLIGYRDARAGKPPRKPLEEIEIIN